jgi:Holliday junction resolvasome RuvABC DNA-binding subunit
MRAALYARVSSEEDFIGALTDLGMTKDSAKQMLETIPHDLLLEQAIQMALKQYSSTPAL